MSPRGRKSRLRKGCSAAVAVGGDDDGPQSRSGFEGAEKNCHHYIYCVLIMTS